MTISYRTKILNLSTNKFETGIEFFPYGDLPLSEVAAERDAHLYAAEQLEKLYPGQWRYAYGDLEAGNFDGQFQWIDGKAGDPVPAVVSRYDTEYVAPAPLSESELNACMDRSVQFCVTELSKPENYGIAVKMVQTHLNPEGYFMFGGLEHSLTSDELVKWNVIESQADELAGGHSGASFGFMCRLVAQAMLPVLESAGFTF